MLEKIERTADSKYKKRDIERIKKHIARFEQDPEIVKDLIDRGVTRFWYV
jgi:hypothetical protein